MIDWITCMESQITWCYFGLLWDTPHLSPSQYASWLTQVLKSQSTGDNDWTLDALMTHVEKRSRPKNEQPDMKTPKSQPSRSHWQLPPYWSFRTFSQLFLLSSATLIKLGQHHHIASGKETSAPEHQKVLCVLALRTYKPCLHLNHEVPQVWQSASRKHLYQGSPGCLTTTRWHTTHFHQRICLTSHLD